MARGFFADYLKSDQDLPCYTDQKLELYKYFECKHVTLKDLLFNTNSLKAFARGMGKGVFNGTSQGDGMQNGGLFVVEIKDSKLEVLFSHVDEYAGHLPDFEKLISIL